MTRPWHNPIRFALSALVLAILAIQTSAALAIGPVLKLQGADRYFVTLPEVDRMVGESVVRGEHRLSRPIALTKIRTLVYPTQRLIMFVDQERGYGVRTPLVIGFDAYFHRLVQADFRLLWDKSVKAHIAEVKGQVDPRSLLSLDLPVNLPSILGGGTPNFSIIGSQRIEMNMRSEWTDSQVSTATNRVSRFPTLTIKQQQQFALTGNIGEKISVTIQQDSQAFSDLDNRISVRYEDRFDNGREGNGIIKKFEAGNVSLSLENAQFTGYTDQHSGLFGIKLESQLGPVKFTSVVSQEKGEGQAATFQAGSQGGQQQIRDVDFRRRTYYFVDASFRRNFTRRDARGFHITSVDSIEVLRVFAATQGSQQNLANIRKAAAYREPPISVAGGLPSGPDSTGTTVERGNYHELDFTEYLADRNLGYIALNTPLQTGDALAVYYVVRNRVTGVRTEYGDVPAVNDQSSEASLRLLKTRQEQPLDPSVFDDPNKWGVWQYEWRNVYYLGKTELNPEGFELRVIKREAGRQEQDVDEQGRYYIQTMGLDRRGVDPGSPADQLIDIDPELINFQRGELIFPDLYPFAPALTLNDNGLAFPITQGQGLSDETPELYTKGSTDINTNIASFNKYYLNVTYRDRLAQYSLGRSNIIEGSEVVKLNGRPLQRGSDYVILYEVGQIRFLNEAALDPTAEVAVQYQFAPFFKPAANTLMGFQGRYEVNANSWIRGTVLYRSDKSLDQKSRVGRETGRYLLWDFDTRLTYKPEFLTSMVNLLPFVNTDAPSSLNISAELAQSIPDPNTRGDGFIDDFESAKEETDLGVRRAVWSPASPPDGKTHLKRANLFWFNSEQQVDVREIFPNREVLLRDALQHVLTLQMNTRKPDLRWGGLIVDSQFIDEWSQSSPSASRARWGGIVRSLVGASIDQTRSKFIEIWVNGAKGEFHIDLGSIGEDVNANGQYDTEDDRSDGFGNGLIDPGEDIGQDGVPDEQELGFDSEALAAKQFDSVTNPDPHNDNFRFDPTPARDFKFDKVDYSQLNGTEDNLNDPDRGRRPNSEDINNSGFIDNQNNYYKYKIDLSPDSPDTELVAGGDKNQANWGSSHSWRMYRVPLNTTALNQAYSGQIGSPSFALIEFVRLWVTEVEDSVALRIASIEIVGNKWQEDEKGAILDTLGKAIPIGNLIADRETFEVSVKNTFDNPGEYTSPPGAIVEFDRISGVQNREQALSLTYQNLQPYHTAQAFQTFYNDNDLTLYNQMRLNIYGSEDLAGDQSPEVFIRFGNGNTDYYEYRNNVLPGWDPQNQLTIQFIDLTLLKNDTEIARLHGTFTDTTVTIRLSDNIERLALIKLGNVPGRKIAIVDYGDGRQITVQGTPSLSRVRQITAGVYNPRGYRLNKGEIWIDELRASDVRRDRGLAGRFSIDADLADFANIRGSYQKIGNHYRLIGQPEAGSTTSLSDLNTDFQLDKFLPKSWGVVAPVRLRWTHDLRLPRLQVGSDIVLLRPEDRQEQRTESNRRTFSIGYSKKTGSKNLLVKWTLERIRFNYSSSFDARRNITSIDTTSNYQGAFSYDLSPRNPPGIQFMKWAEARFVPKFISNATFTPVPSQLRWDARIDRNRQSGLNRQFSTARTNRFTRNLSRNLAVRMSPLKAVSADYTLSLTNDMRADSTISIAKLKFGPETDYRQSFGIDIRPTIVTWFQPGYQFTTNYQENRNPQLQLSGASPDDRTVTQTNRRSVRTTLSMDRLLTSAFGNLVKSAGKKQDATKNAGPNVVVRGVRAFFGVLNPINMTYTIDNNQNLYNIRSRQRAAYRFGFSALPNLASSAPDTASGANQIITIQRDRQTETVGFDLDTGFKLVSDLNITVRPAWKTTSTRSSNTNLRQTSRTWPETGLRWSPPIRKLKGISRVFRRVDFSSGYSRRVDHSTNLNLAATSSLGQTAETVTTSTGFSPVVGIALDWNAGMTTRISYDKSNDISRLGLSATDQKRAQSNFTFGVDYRINPGFKIPFFGRGKKLKGNLTLRSQVTRTLNETLISRDQTTFKPSNGQKQLAFTIRSDYGFSQHVRGGLNFEWTNTRNTITKEKRLLRQGGFWTEFQFN